MIEMVTRPSLIHTVARLAFAIFLFANAIAPGVCAALRSSSLMLPTGKAKAVTSGPSSQAASCSSCPDAKRSSGPRQWTSQRPGACCAWIGNKTDPPTVLAKACAGDSLQWAIDLQQPLTVDHPAEVLCGAPRLHIDDRGPPRAPVRILCSRAPPSR